MQQHCPSSLFQCRAAAIWWCLLLRTDAIFNTASMPLPQRCSVPLLYLLGISVSSIYGALFKICHHIYTQECMHTCRFCTACDNWKGIMSIFDVLKGELISLKGNEVKHLLSREVPVLVCRIGPCLHKGQEQIKYSVSFSVWTRSHWFSAKTHVDFSDASLCP